MIDARRAREPDAARRVATVFEMRGVQFETAVFQMGEMRAPERSPAGAI